MEIWKEVPDTNGQIFVSNLGRMKSYLRSEEGLILKSQKDQKGYDRISVTIDRVKHTFKVHRGVAEAFVDLVPGKNQVNHKDGCKDNNKASNLEWVTGSENCKHAYDNGLWKAQHERFMNSTLTEKKPIVAVNIESGERILFESISDAERSIGSRHICDVLKGKRTQASGYHFFYVRG